MANKQPQSKCSKETEQEFKNTQMDKVGKTLLIMREMQSKTTVTFLIIVVTITTIKAILYLNSDDGYYQKPKDSLCWGKYGKKKLSASKCASSLSYLTCTAPCTGD